MDEQKFTGDSSNLSFPAAQGREASADAPGERKSSPIFPGDIVDGSWDFEPLTFPDFAAEAEKGPRHAAPKRNILSVIGGDASDSSETGESAAQQGATGESASQESPTVFLPEGASSEGAHPLDHMSAAPVAVDQPSTRTETAGGEQTVTLPPVSGNAENPLDLDELADSDSDSRRSASGKRAGTAGKKRIIIIAVVLAVVLVAGIGGFMLWKGSQSGKRDDAVAACSRAAEQYNKARKALDAALKDAKSAQTITSAQVTDAATVQQLKQQVDNAGRFGEAQSCATSRSLTDLKNGAKFMQTKSDDMSRSAAAIRKAASAVNVSKTAKDFDSLKDAVATAQGSITGRNKCFAVTDNSADEYPAAAQYMRKMMQDDIIQKAVFGNPQFDKFCAAFCERLAAEETGDLHLAVNFTCSCTLRVDDQRKTEFAAHHIELLRIFGAAYASNRVQTEIHTACGEAAE